MRVYLPDFPVLNPCSLKGALEALDGDEAVTPLAGGTDVLVYMESGDFEPTTLLNLYALQDIAREPRLENGHLILGPLSTYRHARHVAACQGFPMLATAAREVSTLALQSRATWVGNVANASPAADGVPALMAHDAVLELSSLKGTREVPLHAFYSGYKQMDRKPHELITVVKLPTPEPGWRDYYRKVGTRRFQAISKTLLAARIKLNNDRMIEDVRLVFASVAPYTLRATETESLLRGQTLTPELVDRAAAAIQDEISPIDDIRSDERYRRRVTSNLVRDFLGSLY